MLLECHGTGTRVGDPIEVGAAGNVFGPGRSDAYEDRLVVSSVKTNMGHLEGACAFPGILKVVSAIEAGEIPPILGFHTANTRIDFDKAKARVVTKVEPWPKDKLKRASVTSAGFGGTNGHCIIDHVHNFMPDYVKPGILLDSVKSLGGTNMNGVNGHHSLATSQAPQHRPMTSTPTHFMKADATTRQLVVLPFSAHNQQSLAANMDALSRAAHKHSLADVAYTLSAKRSRFSQRAYSIVDRDHVQRGGGVGEGLGRAQQQKVSTFFSPLPIRVGFVFTGQGAQWHAMGAELFEYGVFRDTISFLDGVLARLPQPGSWRIADVLKGNCDEDLIQTPAVAQTLCTALQIGLVDLLASWSIRPAAVVGHSSGEMAAAYASGRLSASEAITAAYYRGYVVCQNQQSGAMLAVGLSAAQGSECIRHAGFEDTVKVAAINSPDSITISGDAEHIQSLNATLDKAGVFNRLLRTGGLAYHSHHMLALGLDYGTMLTGAIQGLDEMGLTSDAHKYPSVPWISSVIPEKDMAASKERITPGYWRANLESPVQFSEAVSNLLGIQDLAIGAVVEIGPHPAMKSPLGQIIKGLGKTIPHIGTLKRGEDGRSSLLNLAGSLFAHHADVDLVAVNAVEAQDSQGVSGLAHGCTAVDLPPYQYTYGPVKYHESRLSKEYRLRQVPRHDLLGSKVPGTARLRPQWRNILRLKDLPWLDDHRVPPHVLHPGAAHIVMAMVAAEQAYAEFPDALPIAGLCLRNFSIKKTLVVPEDDYGVEIVLSMELEDSATAKSPGWATFSIASVVRDSQQWTEHCAGSIKIEVSSSHQAARIDTADMDGRLVAAEAWYARFADMGLQFGPSFQGYSDILADPYKNIVSAKLALKTTEGMLPGGESSYPIHPASLDLVIRLGLMACNGGQVETASVQLPIHFDQMQFKYNSLQGRDWATGVSRGELRGLRGAYAELQMLDEAGNVILHVDNMRFTSLHNEQQSSLNDLQSSTKAFASPFARLVWGPDVRTFSKAQWRGLFTSVEGSTGSKVAGLLSKIVDLFGHVRPDLRVAEVNSGEDRGEAQVFLRTLTGPNGIKRYRSLTLAAATQEELDKAREATSGFSNVEYSILDIAKDPMAQGSAAECYDMILLPISWRHTDSETQTLVENSRALLTPGGRLVVIEQLKDEASRAKAWDDVLLASGFVEGAEVTLEQPTEPGQRSVITLATPSDAPGVTSTNGSRSPMVYLLHGQKGKPDLLTHMAAAMESRGVRTMSIPLDQVRDDVLSPNVRVVAFLDGENLLLAADQQRIGIFQHLAANASSMLWITSCGMVKGRNPDGAFVAGLLRTLGTENPSGHFLSVDIDAEDFRVKDKQELDELVRCLADQESALQHADVEVNRELTWQDGLMWVSRVVPDSGLHDYAEMVAAPEEHDLQSVTLSSQAPVRAAFGVPGILTSLYFRPYTELWQPLPHDAIDVKVEAVGLNWKDLGLCSGRFDQNNLSNEYCGIVSRKGSAVYNLDIGDHVYGIGKGHFGNYTRVPAALAQKLRPGVDPIEAATMPLVYMTAVYAFEYVTRLRRGQKVLIQSASGGLGLAALQLARSKGAEVFATVGTAEKARFLSEVIGLPVDHVFSSRGSPDLSSIASATRDGGFDVILSTAQGDMLYESIKALAPLGTLVDVGRLDVTGSKSMAMQLFQKSAGFTSFDLGLLVDHDVGLGGDLMRRVDEHYRAGRIGSIHLAGVSSISQLDKALLELSKGKHTGKMVVSYRDPESVIKVHQPVPQARFDPGARYVLVGGLSGFGRSIVRWMVDRGAQDLIVWSRSGSKNLSGQAVALVAELKAQGVSLAAVACDVSDRNQVMRAMDEASSGRTVRGVFNFAVSYQDISFDKMTADKFQQGMAAKVSGTKNLHEATVLFGLNLDFFVMVSSLGTVYAFPTQSVYLAANNFLDYFARYRRCCGLPATTVSLGFISDLGALTNDPVTVNLFVRTRGQTVTTGQVLRQLEPAFVSHRVNGDDSGARSIEEWVGRFQDPLSGANIVTGIDPAALMTMRRHAARKSKTAPSGRDPVPRWYHDARVSLMLQALEDGWKARDGAAGRLHDLSNTADPDQSPAAQLRRQFEISVASIRDNFGTEKDAMEKTVRLVVDAIVASVAGMLFVDVSAVNADNTVADQGIDSLLAAEFRNWLYVSFGKNISMLDLMDPRTKINALALSIVEGAAGT